MLFLFILLLINKIRTEQDKNLLIHYDFKTFTDKIVTDCTGNGNDAILQNEATIYSMGKYNVLNLGIKTGYLDLGTKFGEIFASTNDFTISMYYRVHEDSPLDMNGRFLWTFSTLQNNEARNGLYHGYRLNAQRLATSTGGYENEHGMELGLQSPKGRWIHISYTQTNKKGKLFIDGIEKLTNDDMPLNTENFVEKPIYNWIGSAAFSQDNYLINTLVYDIRFYNRLLSTEEISTFSELCNDLDIEYNFGSNGNRTEFNQRINDAKEILSKDTSKYKKMSLFSYKQLLSYCESLQKLENLSQPFLNYLCTQFDLSKNILISFADDEYEKFKVADKEYNIERGFLHPGGVLTEEDFLRIKEQIKNGTNQKVKDGFNLLKQSSWSQTWRGQPPVEVVKRGIAGDENYILAARAAHIAFQNALRWKLEDNDDHAQHAIDILMDWARVCKLVSGNSNWALATGIYGYQFAQAAEILRTYKGWKEDDFNFFKDWMIRVWALPCYSFLSGRLGTWENSHMIPGVGHGAEGQRPGHYWSNWGLCNVLALQSIALLCDDVFLYNQALSFYKYDQTTQANWNTDTDLYNRGVMEYINNLVPHVSEFEEEKNTYGKIGQMQESGRDQGHACFALGLAVDICLTAWNQGDDLFSYNDNRLAAGIEFVSAYNNAKRDDLPWVNYHYATGGTAWHNAVIHNGPSEQQRGHIRPYWGKIIGHYKGIKGITLPFAEIAYDQMGVDGGCDGGAGWAYDHFGFSTLLYTRDETAKENQKPTLLTPMMIYNNQTINHNELGALTNNFMFMKNKAVPCGDKVKLMLQLPVESKDTGKWSWNTGETTKDITVTTDKSYVYRVTYTNENNVKSYQSFSIAADGDCIPSTSTTSALVNGEFKDSSRPIIVSSGDTVTLRVEGNGEWGSFIVWENGIEGFEYTFMAVDDINISVKYVYHCGASNLHTFYIKIDNIKSHFVINENNHIYGKSSHVVKTGDNILIKIAAAAAISPNSFIWNDGSSGNNYNIKNIQTTTSINVKSIAHVDSLSCNKIFRFFVEGNKEYELKSGNYIIKDTRSGKILTNSDNINETMVSFSDQKKMNNNKYDPSQVWTVQQLKNENGNLRYTFNCYKKDTFLGSNGLSNSITPYHFQLWNAVGTNELMIYDENKEFLWFVDQYNGQMSTNLNKELYGYPFQFIQCHSSQLPDEEQKNTKGGKNKTGIIVGVVVGVIALIAIVVVVIVLVMKKRKSNQKSNSEFSSSGKNDI